MFQDLLVQLHSKKEIGFRIGNMPENNKTTRIKGLIRLALRKKQNLNDGIYQWRSLESSA